MNTYIYIYLLNIYCIQKLFVFEFALFRKETVSYFEVFTVKKYLIFSF